VSDPRGPDKIPDISDLHSLSQPGSWYITARQIVQAQYHSRNGCDAPPFEGNFNNITRGIYCFSLLKDDGEGPEIVLNKPVRDTIQEGALRGLLAGNARAECKVADLYEIPFRRVPHANYNLDMLELNAEKILGGPEP